MPFSNGGIIQSEPRAPAIARHCLAANLSLRFWRDRVVGVGHPKAHLGGLSNEKFRMLRDWRSCLAGAVPQELAPCGGRSTDPGTPTHAITEARGGDMLHIKIREAIFHPATIEWPWQ
jgi:hypothetical protein